MLTYMYKFHKQSFIPENINLTESITLMSRIKSTSSLTLKIYKFNSISLTRKAVEVQNVKFDMLLTAHRYVKKLARSVKRRKQKKFA